MIRRLRIKGKLVSLHHAIDVFNVDRRIASEAMDPDRSSHAH